MKHLLVIGRDEDLRNVVDATAAHSDCRVSIVATDSEGLDLVNSKGHVFQPGHKFNSCKILIGKTEAMAELEVTGTADKHLPTTVTLMISMSRTCSICQD